MSKSRGSQLDETLLKLRELLVPMALEVDWLKKKREEDRLAALESQPPSTAQQATTESSTTASPLDVAGLESIPPLTQPSSHPLGALNADVRIHVEHCSECQDQLERFLAVLWTPALDADLWTLISQRADSSPSAEPSAEAAATSPSTPSDDMKTGVAIGIGQAAKVMAETIDQLIDHGAPDWRDNDGRVEAREGR